MLWNLKSTLFAFMTLMRYNTLDVVFITKIYYKNTDSHILNTSSNI